MNSVRTLTSSQFYELEQMILSRFMDKGEGQRGLTSLWLNGILDYFEVKGHQVIPGDIIEAEESLIKVGLAKEYFAALAEVVGANKPGVTEDNGALLIITSNAEERAKAIEKVRQSK
jgi:hypothetical protein